MLNGGANQHTCIGALSLYIHSTWVKFFLVSRMCIKCITERENRKGEQGKCNILQSDRRRESHICSVRVLRQARTEMDVFRLGLDVALFKIFVN